MEQINNSKNVLKDVTIGDVAGNLQVGDNNIHLHLHFADGTKQDIKAEELKANNDLLQQVLDMYGIKSLDELLIKKESINKISNLKTTKKNEGMTYEKFKEFLPTASMPDIFDVLDEYISKTEISTQTTYNQIKKEHENGETPERKLKERLQVLSKKFLA